MAPDSPVNFSSGLPETVLPPESHEALTALASALSSPENERRVEVAAVAARWPRFLDAWARLGQLAGHGSVGSDVAAYAYFRVGYHRGLDSLRQAGWRGSGYVRWANESNRGFLRALEGLRRAAGAIGEVEEERRCAEFRQQLDPNWDGADPSN